MRRFWSLSTAALGAALLVAPAGAQQPSPELDLKLTPAEMAVIEQGLGKLPLETGLLTFQRVVEQVRAQQQAKPPEKSPWTGD